VLFVLIGWQYLLNNRYSAEFLKCHAAELGGIFGKPNGGEQTAHAGGRYQRIVFICSVKM